MAETNANAIRQRELHNRLVIDLETTEELGRLSHFMVDVKNHQIEGFVCRSGLLGQDRIPVMWVQVESVGKDSILVRRSGALITERFDAAIPLDHQEIWTDGGDRIGLLVDYCLDLATGTITEYRFTAPGWQSLTDGVYRFDPTAVVSTGKKRMMVQQTALANAEQVSPGVPDRLSDTWQQDVSQTRQDLQAVLGNTQEVAAQVQEQTQKIAEQAKSKFGGVLGEVKRRSRQLRGQINDRFADMAANVQDQSPQPRESIAGTTIDVDSEPVWQEETATVDEPQPANAENPNPASDEPKAAN